MKGIYAIISPTGRVYIGQSVNIQKRFSNYIKLQSSVIAQTKLYRSLVKYGIENHIFQIMEECDIKILTDREGHWQDFFDSVKNGLNCFRVKTTDKSGYMSEETKQRVSKNRKGKNCGKQHYSFNNKVIGRPHTQENIEIIKIRQQGATNSNAKKIKNTLTGEIYSCVGELSKITGISASTLYKKLNTKNNKQKNNTIYTYYSERKEDINP